MDLLAIGGWRLRQSAKLVFAALNLTRSGFRDLPPFWDRDLQELYEARLNQAGSKGRKPARQAPQPPTRLRRGR